LLVIVFLIDKGAWRPPERITTRPALRTVMAAVNAEAPLPTPSTSTYRAPDGGMVRTATLFAFVLIRWRYRLSPRQEPHLVTSGGDPAPE